MTKNVPNMIMGKSEVSARSKAYHHPADNNSPVGASIGLADTTLTSVSDKNASQIAQKFLAVVASDTENSTEDMESSDSFADREFDSLMNIALVSTNKQESGVEIPGSFCGRCDERIHDDG